MIGIIDGTTAVLVPVPSRLLQAGGMLAVLVGLSAVLIAATYLIRRRTATKIGGWTEEDRFSKFSIFLNQAMKEIRAIGLTRRFYEAFALSFLFLSLQALTFWLLIRAYGLELSFPAGAVVYLVVHVGTIIPNAPANIGLFQFFSILGLTIFHVERPLAVGFSVVAFFPISAPLWLL